jgi:tyrosinase
LSDPIENPLAFHEFVPTPDGFQDQIFSTSMAKTGAMSYFKTWDRTYRWPSSKLNPIEDYVKINKYAPFAFWLIVSHPSDTTSPPLPRLLRGAKDARGSAKQLRESIGNLFCYPAPGEVPDEHQFPSLYVPSLWSLGRGR